MFAAGIALSLWSCTAGPEDTGRIFMPDMYYSSAYDTYSKNPNFQDSMTARPIVEGTIARGMLSNDKASLKDTNYHYSFLYQRYFEDTPDDYNRAGDVLKNPIAMSKEVVKEGKKLYEINCAVCHGEKGAGDGTIVQTGAYPPVPKYSDRLPTINEGKMYHSITYGKNLMGAYSSHLTPEDRWKVIYYIQKLAEVGPFAKQVEEALEEESTETEEQVAEGTASI